MARRLAEALGREGYSVWWDREILPGKSFDEIIKERLDAAQCLIVLWSKASVSSDWVRDEAAEGLRRKILVPVVIAEVEIPLGFRRVQVSNLTSWRGQRPDQEFDLLLASVAGLLGGAGKQPLDLHKDKPRPGWKRWGPIAAVLVLMACVGAYYFIKASVFRYSDQYTYAEQLVRKYNFYSTGTERWSRPNVGGFPHDFKLQGDVIQDAATGLVWQKGGSPDISFPEITGYLRTLNAERFGGRDDWRLPTLAEAWTLLSPQQTPEGRHIDRVFDPKQEWIWTSNTTKNGYGWFVFFTEGRPIFQNAWGSHGYVRAVSGPRWE